MEARTTSPVWATCCRMRSPARRASRLSSAARISACSCTESLQRDFPFYVWDEQAGEVRWMCSWDTTEDDVDQFAAAVRDALS